MTRTRSNRTQSAFSSATDPERLMRDIRRFERSALAAEKQKDNEKDSEVADLKEEKKEKSDSVSEFDCNICFEVAKEPVVTHCGHLFCWPCLYQWLHLHCDHKECPVCKGSVDESSIVPIYGRGSSDRKNKADGNRALKIPPRPQGNRTESLRQQLRNPFFRISEVMIEESVSEELFTELPERAQSRQMLERRNTQLLPRNSPLHPLTVTSSHIQDGVVSRQPISIQDATARLPGIIAQLRSLIHRREQTLVSALARDSQNHDQGRRREQAGRAAVGENLVDSDPSLSQASTSSTVAVIREDVAANDALLAPNRGDSSVNHRRRGRSRTLDSSDASERVNPVRQRRRSN